MPSPPMEEESDMPTTESCVQVANEAGQSSGQEVLDGARVSASAAAAAAAETRPTPTCCVCTEPWSCSGAHRICCIPCGHVFGRSCLEKWLGACGNTSAKCPQCGAGFEQKHIINIYPPGDLFDGCSCMQEVETHHSKITEFRASVAKLFRQHSYELEIFKPTLGIFEAPLSSNIGDRIRVIQSVFQMMQRHHTELSTLVCQLGRIWGRQSEMIG